MTAPKKPRARAPKPKAGGYDAAADRIKKAQEVIRIHPEGTDVDFTYAPHNVPIRVRARIRDEFGQSYDEWLFTRGAVDVQTFAQIWWITRLISGENCTLEQVYDEWDQRCAGISETDQIVQETVEGSADSGEADAPAT